jgi:hypothetical protein
MLPFNTAVTYDWFERENTEHNKYHGHQYQLVLTKQQYDQMKSLVSPQGMPNNRHRHCSHDNAFC